MKKSKRILTIVAVIALIGSVSGCTQKETNEENNDKTSSLLVDAEKESIDYAEVSEVLPELSDTDYEYITSSEEEESKTESKESSAVASSPTQNPDNAGGGGGDNGSPKAYDPERYKPVSPLADPESVDLSVFSVFNGDKVDTYDFNELADMPVEEFVEKTGFTVIKDKKYEGSLTKDYDFEGTAYLTGGEGSPVVYIETYIKEDDKKKEERVSAIVFPEMSSYEASSYIKIGGEDGLKLAPDAYNVRFDEAFGSNYRRIISEDKCYARLYHDEDVFAYFHFDEDAFLKEAMMYKANVNYRY